MPLSQCLARVGALSGGKRHVGRAGGMEVLQALPQESEDIAPHLRRLRVPHVVAQQLPVVGLAQASIDGPEFTIDAVQPGRRRQSSRFPAVARCGRGAINALIWAVVKCFNNPGTK
jgi:hypothetical protein